MISAPQQRGPEAALRPQLSRVSAPIRVMLCDDSLVVRSALSKILETDPAIEIVARVADGRAALDACIQYKPEILILDIEMPVMDGLTALPLLLARSPGTAIIMASTLSTRGADISMRALRLGAADTVAKPTANLLGRDQEFGTELIAKVHGLARIRRRTPLAGAAERSVASCYPTRDAPMAQARLLALGSSTGGPNALFTLIQQLGSKLPVPAVLTQHMPPSFTPILAQHLDKLGMPCCEGQDGDELRPGHLTVAPGNRHLLVRRSGPKMFVQLSDGPAENYCRPSVDPMLRSACEAADGRVLVAMLTGMGQDGLLGSRLIVEAGGAVIAQDEATSVVWGMPGAVARAGLAHAILPLPQLADKIKTMLNVGTRK